MVPAAVSGVIMFQKLGLRIGADEFLEKIWAPYVLIHGVPIEPPPEWKALRGLRSIPQLKS
jgi:hypothetical protein